jgi:hypothetical protein
MAAAAANTRLVENEAFHKQFAGPVAMYNVLEKRIKTNPFLLQRNLKQQRGLAYRKSASHSPYQLLGTIVVDYNNDYDFISHPYHSYLYKFSNILLHILCI